MQMDPEEPEFQGPSWAHVEPRDDDFLRGIHDDFLAVRQLDRWTNRRYFTPQFEDEEKKLVAWTQVSPSQVESYQKCKRLWFFKSILRLPETQKGNQALGEGVHLILEVSSRVAQGDFPRVDYEYSHSDVKALDAEGWAKAEALAKIMVPMIPRSKGDKIVLQEQKILLPTYENGPLMLGYMDLGVPPGIGWPELMIPSEHAVVGDYKTLSDFRYMRTPQELADSVQMMTYAKWAISDMSPSFERDIQPIPSEDHLYLAHLYGRTKPPFIKTSVRSSVACVTFDQINEKWERTLDVVRSMDQDAKANDAQDIEATGVMNNHCSAYGGCAFRDRCGLNQPNPIKNLFSIKKNVASSPTEVTDMTTTAGSSLLAKVAAARARERGETEPAAPVTPAPAVPVSTPTPVKNSLGPISTLLDEVAAKNAGGKPSLTGLLAMMYAKEQSMAIQPGSAIPGVGTLSNVTCRSMVELVALNVAESKPVIPSPTGIVPNDAPPRTQPVITRPGDGVDPIKANVATPASSPTDSIADDDEDESAPQSPATAEVVDAPAPKRGRPTREEKAARDAAEAVLQNAEVERRVAAQLAAQKLADPQKDLQVALASSPVGQTKILGVSEIFTLFVDCAPFKGGPAGMVDYYDWYTPIAAAVAEASKVDDWRMIQYTAKGLLASAMRQAVKNGLPSAMTISRDAAGADIALEILSPLARLIIRRI